jgi:Uma2 family endonuclease
VPSDGDWTVDDLAELAPDGRHELINGRLIVPSVVGGHQALLAEIAGALRANCPPDFVVRVDRSLPVDRRSQLRPEVVAVRAEHAGRAGVEHVVLAVEILASDWTFGVTHAKTRIYMAAGVAHYWVIDATGEKITLTAVLPASDPDHPGVHTAAAYSTDRPWPVTLDLPALAERRARLMARADEPRS